MFVVDFSEVICGSESVSAAADDDEVVLCFGLWRAPMRLPFFVSGERLFEDIESGEFHSFMYR